MPLLGWVGGNFLGKVVADFSPWIAFALLAFIGIKMFVEAFENKKECDIVDITKGKHLLFVCIATSIDAFAAGLSIGLLNIPIIVTLTFIGVITFIMAFSGVYIGKAIGHILEKWAEIAGGVILIGIGVKILVEKLFFC
jgi:putative Mn2+ efflux pump MntP